LLKELDESYLQIVLNWRNHPKVRRSMTSMNLISLDEHIAWFERYQKNEKDKWFIFFPKKDTPEGVVYFKNISQKNNDATWGFYKNPEAKKGTGLKMSLEALDWAFDKLKLTQINSYIRISNIQSINMHKTLGFVEISESADACFMDVNHEDMLFMSLEKQNWIMAKGFVTKIIKNL